MGNRVDFDKLRKKRQRVQTVKRLAILIAVMALIAGVMSLNNFMVDSGVTTKISDVAGSMGGAGYPVAVPGGIIRGIKAMNNDLAILNDTNLYIYNSKGKILTSIQQMSALTVIIPNSSQVLSFDIGSKDYKIHTRTKQVTAKSTEYSIFSADMNERDEYVLCTASKQYIAQVSVFDFRHQEVFRWVSAENPVAGVALSPKGDRLGVGCINTSEGIISTFVYIFDVKNEKELLKLEFNGELLLDINYSSDGEINLLTDKRVARFTASGTQIGEYLFEQMLPSAIERRGKLTLLLLKGAEDRSQKVVLLDEKCSPLASFSPEYKVKDIALSDRLFYILDEKGIFSYDAKGTAKESLNMSGINRIKAVKNKLYYLTREEINVLQ